MSPCPWEALTPRGFAQGTPMGLYVMEGVALSPSRALHRVIDAGSADLLLGIEMLWTSGVGVDGSHELDAALERTVEEGTSFHLYCDALDGGEPAVAVVDEYLTPLEAWVLDTGIRFDRLPPDQVECRAP